MRWSALLSLLFFLVIGIVWRDWHHRRRYGRSGIVFFHGRDAHARVQAIVVPLLALTFGVLAVLDGLHPGPVPPTRLEGILVVLVATAGMVVSQLQMGASWRVGIDPEAKPGLVTGGLYGFCRNPIYAFFLFALVGFVLQVPSLLTMAMTLGAYAGIRIQVRREEQYLLATYGAEFSAYAARVGRFVPGIGLLS